MSRIVLSQWRMVRPARRALRSILNVESLEDRTCPSLVLALGLNEGSGASTSDLSGNGNHGSISGATWAASGKYGGALSFDGINDWLTVADSNSLDLTTGMTLEAWVNPTTINGWETVLLKEATSELAYSLYADNNGTDSGGPRRPAAYVRQGGTSYTTVGSAQLAIGQWAHLAATYDGSALKLYVNSTLAGTFNVSGSINTTTGALRAGGNSVWSEWFNGLIDEIRVYNHALTQPEIQADMNTPITSGPDTTPPNVAITSPTAGASVFGVVDVMATASDNVGVVGVQFFVDGAALGAEDLAAPYTVTWDTSTFSLGSHALTARARDAAGNLTLSSAINVTVTDQDTVPPTVTVTAPANGATVTGTVSVSASASDNVAVVGVQFLLDGSNLGSEDTSAPFSISWNTVSTTNGSHTLTARARDAAGNSTTSSNVTVSVNNGAGTPLTIDGAQQFQLMDGFGVNANVNSWDNGTLQPAIDLLVNDLGASLWRVYIDNTDWETTNDNTDPFSFNWSYYNALYATPRFEEAWGLMTELNAQGITDGLILNFMGPGPSWMGGSTLSTAQEDEWVEMILSYVYYARFNRGIDFYRIAPFNESDWNGLEGIRADQFVLTRVLQKMAVRLDALGMTDVRFIGPETASAGAATQAYIPEMLDNPTVMAKVEDFGFHNYAGDSFGAGGVIANSNYPDRGYWVTEQSFGNSSDLVVIDNLMNHLADGATSTMVFKAYDGQDNHHPPGEDFPLGLLQYNAGSQTYTPRTGYSIIKQVHKFIRPGAVRIAAIESHGALRVFAFQHPTTGQVTILGRNTGGSSVNVSGVLASLPAVTAFEFYHSTSTVGFQQGADVGVTQGSFAFSAPGNSVFTLTSAGNPLPVSVVSTTINGDNSALAGVQRSRVNSIIYVFNQQVSLAAGAFTIAIHSGSTGTLPTLNWASTDGGTTWIVTFAGNGVVGGSIADGRYDLTLHASAVSTQSGGTLASDRTDEFFRLYGDINGDARVDFTDLFAFRAALGSQQGDTNYRAAFDYNGDGLVDFLDFFRFRPRLGTTI